MIQPLVIYHSLIELSSSKREIPVAIKTLYEAILYDKCNIISVKKKMFRRHYVIKITDGKSTDRFALHLTPKKIWWAYKW